MLEKTRHNIDRLYAAWLIATGRTGTLWCGLMHDSPMWPIHGQYQCGACGRRYSVPWDRDRLPPAQTPVARPHGLPAVQPSLRSAILPRVIVLMIALLASHAQAADTLIADSITQVATTPAAIAFARYTAGLEQASPWNLETVEIEAALPKLEKRARLRAIRRLLPLGQPNYQVLEIAGDHTVTRQVIARYLSAEVRAAAIPASTVAISPANYKFRYKCAVNTDAKVIYVFLIAPRKKREGLIKGELWIDGETGAVVRQSGYLVKQPSIFLKRVTIVQETALRAGSAEERVTHLSVDTRLVGLAELTIHERPYTDPVLPPAPVIEQR
ncbi:MAG: hypothetical protein ABSG03_14725 [Bryobacteraceae bacterium]|jgi:hypothetical protein